MGMTELEIHNHVGIDACRHYNVNTTRITLTLIY